MNKEEDKEKSKVETIADLFGFNSVDDTSFKDDDISPYVEGGHIQGVRNWLNVFSLQLPRMPIPDTRLISSESEYIKPLDKIKFDNVKLNLKTRFVFKEKEDSIIYHEYSGMNMFESSCRNYVDYDGCFYLNYSNLSKNLYKIKFKELQDAFGEDLVDFIICPEREIFIKLVKELVEEKKASVFTFKEIELNLHLAEHRMLFVEKFLAFDFSPLYWQIFLNFPLGLSNKFREIFTSYKEILTTRNEAYNSCLYYLDEYLKIEFQ